MDHMKSASEAEASIHGSETLEHLGGIQRTKESTIGAVGAVLVGAKKVVAPNRSKGETRIGGGAQILEGAFNALDIIPSALADGARSLTGPERRRGPSPYNYNISRAIGSFKDIERPRDAIGATVDVIHSIGTRAGVDIARAVRRNSESSANTAA